MIYLPDDTIPRPLYDALIESDKDYGIEVSDYLKSNGKEVNLSVTSLNKPVRELILSSRHHKEIYINPLKDLWHSLMGNIVHWVLEKHAYNNPDYDAECRMGTDISVNGKVVHLHGKFDIYDKKRHMIQDWKLTSASNMLYPKTQYEWQLNILRYIMMANGYKVERLENIYLFPHLDKTKLAYPGYPQMNQMTVNVEIKPIPEVEAYIKENLAVYIKAKDLSDKKLPLCTDEERWIRGTYYAIYFRKKGGKKGEVQEFSTRAAFKSDDLAKVLQFQIDEGVRDQDATVKEFKGEPKHCLFCKAAPFCHQYLNEHRSIG